MRRAGRGGGLRRANHFAGCWLLREKRFFSGWRPAPTILRLECGTEAVRSNHQKPTPRQRDHRDEAKAMRWDELSFHKEQPSHSKGDHQGQAGEEQSPAGDGSMRKRSSDHASDHDQNESEKFFWKPQAAVEPPPNKEEEGEQAGRGHLKKEAVEVRLFQTADDKVQHPENEDEADGELQPKKLRQLGCGTFLSNCLSGSG